MFFSDMIFPLHKTFQIFQRNFLRFFVWIRMKELWLLTGKIALIDFDSECFLTMQKDPVRLF